MKEGRRRTRGELDLVNSRKYVILSFVCAASSIFPYCLAGWSLLFRSLLASPWAAPRRIPFHFIPFLYRPDEYALFGPRLLHLFRLLTPRTVFHRGMASRQADGLDGGGAFLPLTHITLQFLASENLPVSAIHKESTTHQNIY